MNDESSKAQDRLLPDELAPPPGAGDRIADALAARGLIRRNSRSRFGRARWALASAAAAAAAFAVGLLIGAGAGVSARAPRAAGPRFVLFLSPLPSEDAAGEPGRVAEYRRWAAGVRSQGRFIAGEKLEDGGSVVSTAGESAAPPPGSSGAVAGYFVFEAKNLEDAVAIARSCPHVKHGGLITVRAVAPV